MFIETIVSPSISKEALPSSGRAIYFPFEYSISDSVNFLTKPFSISHTPLLTLPFSVIVFSTL